jgi:indolepyruvate ferredoxin oxidoreductase alpha subunit
VPRPGSADVLVALEQSEVFRPGFLATLRPGGTVLLNRMRLVPAGVEPEDYPSPEAIREFLGDRTVIEFDALAESRAIGDELGRASNVVALGLLSTVEPLSRIPLPIWQEALLAVSPTLTLKRANMASFLRGRSL